MKDLSWSPPVKVGDSVKAWFTGPDLDGSSTILDIIPYTGTYPELFNCVLQISSTTQRGYCEMSYRNDVAPEPRPVTTSFTHPNEIE
jgi:hypothetical protein